MKNLYIIESPLQLLNAYEAINTFSAKKHVLLIRLSNNPYGDKQILDTISKLKIQDVAEIKTVKIKVENRGLRDLFTLLLLKFKFLFHSYQKVFIGEYESRFMQFIIPFTENTILLDDGSKTLNTQKQFTETNCYDWFTLFDIKPLNGQNIYKNNFIFLNKFITTRTSSKKNTVLFIGSNLSEDGVISEQYNLELIQKIAKKYSEYQIQYIAHRRESDAKLDRINSISNITTVRLKFPIELLSIYSELQPNYMISFYSTALITLKKIYQAKTIAFKFDYSSCKDKKSIDAVYSYCEKHITVIEEQNI